MRLIVLAAAVFFASGALAQDAAQEAVIQTSQGTITVALDAVHAPQTVANFIAYANEKHFDGTVIYRVVPGFVIQMGSYEANGNPRATHAAIPLEANNGLSNVRGSVAMARGDDPASATAEFFISLSDNSASLDHAASDTGNATGYAVFGHVAGGMDVVDKIAAVPLGGAGPFAGAAPATPVTIEKVSIVTVPPAPPAATQLPPDTH
ncbi:MAG TPA: peptidylprolyl isomerase [Rhizomicrobium sp.]|jgi:cyclophilin family peptidyl-prolyl cis-trans isomerase